MKIIEQQIENIEKEYTNFNQDLYILNRIIVVENESFVTKKRRNALKIKKQLLLNYIAEVNELIIDKANAIYLSENLLPIIGYDLLSKRKQKMINDLRELHQKVKVIYKNIKNVTF